jgi:hypothetical protein
MFPLLGPPLSSTARSVKTVAPWLNSSLPKKRPFHSIVSPPPPPFSAGKSLGVPLRRNFDV